MGDFSVKRFYIDLATARTGYGELTRVSGRAIKVASASSPNAHANLAMQGDFTADPLEVILQAEIAIGQGFEGFYITNDAQPGEWIVLIVTNGDDDFDYKYPVSNSISSIASVVDTSDADTHDKLDTLHADMAGTHADLVAVKTSADAINAALADKNVKRAAMTTLHNATYFTSTGASTATLVSSGTNVNGIIIRRAKLWSANNIYGYVTAGGNTIMSAYAYYNASVGTFTEPDVVENLFIPPGQALAVNIGASSLLHIHYEVL